MPTSVPEERRPVRKPRKTATLLAQRIVGEITAQDLAPGTPLRAERDMLEQYGVARGTLREALRFLEMQGVITIKTGPGGGPVVSRPESRHLASTIAMMLQLRHASFRSVLEARAVLEPALARLAAERITREELEQLSQVQHEMRDRIGDLDGFLAGNVEFHRLIADAAGNQVFALVIASINWICDATALGVRYSAESQQVVVDEHARIYKAIASGNPDRAGAAMSMHIADFSEYLEKRYPSVLDEPLRWDQIDG
jgi:DNA-binding FadR family transcriptional regulator